MKAFRVSFATLLAPVCLVALILVPTLAQETSKPASTPSPKVDRNAGDTTLPTGSIKGRVVSDDGRPINNASITAGGSGMMAQKMTRVDSDGRFALEELPVARYTIMVVAPGYVDQGLMQSDPRQRLKYLIGSQLKIVMLKGGVITGTVTDSKGQPIVGVPVSAAQIGDVSVFGSYMTQLAGGAETDDRGVYRIFGLPPGQYTVGAGGGGPFGQFSASGFDLDVPTFYPSATRDTALPVTVRGGDETAGIDIKYRGLEGHSISGTVTGVLEANASIAGAVTITLSHAATSSVVSFGVANPTDQRRAFGFNGVGDGEYDLLAMFVTGINEDPLVGTKRVIVRGGDVTAVEIHLTRLGSIAGTITLDPIKPEDMCDKRRSYITETDIAPLLDEPRKPGSQVMTQMFGAYGGTLNAKGEFAVRSLEAGRYRLGITLPTEAWYVRGITTPSTAPPAAKPTGTQPSATWQGTITLKSGERLAPVSIMIGQDAAGLRGRVEVTSGSAIPAGLRVHLVPAEREEANNVLRYNETVLGSDGSFAFTNLAPGKYLIVASHEPSIETGNALRRPAALDPNLRSKVRKEAETANTTVELKPCQQLADYKLPLK
jgi:hypothetical protein